jgi:drug/metabolite transporter (DMT)-like permease
MTKWLAFTFALGTVLLQVFSQLALKYRVVGLSPNILRVDGVARYLFTLLRDPWVIAALLAAFCGMLTWMLALIRLPLSQAYPFVAATIPLVALLGAVLFGEPVPVLRAVGLATIVIGIFFVAVS